MQQYGARTSWSPERQARDCCYGERHLLLHTALRRYQDGSGWCLEAIGDVVHHPVDGRFPVAEEAPFELDMADLDWCECHVNSLL